MRRTILTVSALALLAAPAFAQEGSRWGADDLRRVLADWMRETGREPGPLASIGPLDPRLSLPACEKLDIAPRGAAGTSFSVRCDGPSPWQHVLRIDSAAPSTMTRAAEAAPAGQSAPQGMFRVIVPKIDLTAGTILAAGDLEERPVSSAPGATAIKSIGDVTGLRLLSSISPGVALTTRHVARAPSVAKGENVTLIANGSGFEISIPGRAEQDGHEGDVINVRNVRTGAVMKGRIERGKTVSVLQL